MTFQQKKVNEVIVTAGQPRVREYDPKGLWGSNSLKKVAREKPRTAVQ